MVENGDIEEFESLLNPSSDRPIILTGRWVPGRVIVVQDHSTGGMVDHFAKNLAGVNGAAGNAATK